MKLQYLDFEHNMHSVECKRVREVIPFQSYMLSPALKKPYSGLLSYQGKILPILGAVPTVWEESENYDERPWIMILEKHAVVIYGLPHWDESEDDTANASRESAA